jgi:hypothetical protein
MEYAIIMLFGLGLTALVAALLLGGGWLLRRVLPPSHALQAKLAIPKVRRSAWWVFERIELWTLLLLLAFFTVVTFVYS